MLPNPSAHALKVHAKIFRKTLSNRFIRPVYRPMVSLAPAYKSEPDTRFCDLHRKRKPPPPWGWKGARQKGVGGASVATNKVTKIECQRNTRNTRH